jgi:hypothetical protein
MNRYNTAPTITENVTGTRKLSTMIIPVPPSSNSDVYIQTTSIERLDLLANKFYGDSTLWYLIAAANGLGKGSLYTPANIKLRIPAATNIEKLIENTNISR